MIDENINQVIQMYEEIDAFLNFLEKEEETIENKE